jgi:hypothetical protein
MDSSAPKMDDMAASQQLLEESQTPAKRALGGKTTSSLKKAPSMRFPLLNSPFFAPATNDDTADLKVRDDPALRSDAFEAPNSQVEQPTNPSRTLMSPPMTSSFAAPGNLSQATPSKKGKRNKRAKLNRSSSELNHEILHGHEDTVNGALESPLSSVTLSNRKRRSYAAELGRGATESPQARPPDSAQKEKTTLDSSSVPVMADVALIASAAPLRRQKSRIGNLLAPDPIEDDDTSLSERSERVEKTLLQFKKAKPGHLKRKSVELDDDSAAAEDSISEAADEAAPAVSPRKNTAQTPKALKGTRKGSLKASGKLSSIKNRKGKAAVSQPNIEDPFTNSQPTFDAEETLEKDKKLGTDEEKGLEDGLFVYDTESSQPGPSLRMKTAKLPKTPRPPKTSTKPQEKSKKPQRKSTTNTAALNPDKYRRKSTLNTAFSAAERALNDVRDLPIQPDRRTSGEFAADEDELIRRAIRGYQQDHNLDTAAIVEIIQWTNLGKNHRSSDLQKQDDPEEDDVEIAKESRELWDEIKQCCPTRTTAYLRGHVRAKYNAFKTGTWSEGEDEQLKSLVEEFGNQWKLIASIMDRSSHDIYNRWNDYLQHGDSRKDGRWSQDEENLLVEAIKTVVQRDEDERAAAGEPRRKAYSSQDIKWKEVCAELGGIRSRVQCLHKWRSLSKRDPPINFQPVYNERRPRESILDAASEYDDVATMSTKKMRRSKLERGVSKTDEYRTPHKGMLKKSSEVDGSVTTSTKAKKQSKSKPKEPKTAEKSKKRPSMKSKDATAFAVPEEVVEDDVPQEDLPQNDIPRDNVNQNDLPEDDVSQDNVHQDDTPQDALPRDATPQDSTAQDDLAQDANLQNDSPQDEGTEDNTSDYLIPATAPAPSLTSIAFQSASPGVAQMRWGDKLDLLEAVASGSSENEEDIDWRAVAAALNGSWSVTTLQRALKQLLQLVSDQGNVIDTAYAAVEHLSNVHSSETLKEHFNANNTVDVQPDKDAGPDTEWEEAAAATPKPKTGGKRKRNTDDGLSASRSAAAKRKKGGTASRKPAILIPMSDDM